MKCTALAVVGAVAVALALARPASAAEPPHVVATVPVSGATDVDPSLNELRVTFDQNMLPGFSWGGSGPRFPNLDGSARWLDPRTCVLPVRLEAGREYEVWVNKGRAANFASWKRVPAREYRLWFRTANAGPAVSTANEPWRLLNRQAWDELTAAIDARYAFRDAANVDWPARYARFRPTALSALSAHDWVRNAMEMLSVADDPGLMVWHDGECTPVARRLRHPDCNDDAVKAAFPDAARLNPSVVAGRARDAVPFIRLTSMESADRLHFELFDRLMRSLQASPALILDLRLLSGGDESVAALAASWFADERVVYAQHDVRDAEVPGGFRGPFKRSLDPRGGGVYPGTVYVLCGRNMSGAAESLALMLKACPRAFLVGAPTAGCSGNPQAVRLSNAVAVYIPQYRNKSPDGSLIERVGVPPDVVVDPPAEAFSGGDPVLAKALELARSAPAAP